MFLLSGFSLGVMAVFFLIVARDFGHLNVGKVFLAILLSGACFLIEPHLPHALRSIASDIYTMVPALFWLLCRVAFSYRPKVLSPSGLLAVYTFIAPALARFMGITQDQGIWHLLGWIIPAYGEYLIVTLGLWTVWYNWQDDLVESRRRLRGVVLIGVGIGVLLVIVPLNTGFMRAWLPYLSIAVLTLVCAYSLLRGRNGVLFGIPPHATDAEDESIIAAIPEVKDQQYTRLLGQLMEQGFYRTEHLTLKMLATELSLPEYKTRALINQTMGYRNFNDYINQLRIQEAALHLLREPDTPVLNISLDVGYRTLSSFNRAFKDIQDMSPSEYRAQALATHSS